MSKQAVGQSTLLTLYQHLLTMYGRQAWWPANSAFEVMVGAILTQNTAWRNVEKAIACCKQARCLDPEPILAVAAETLEHYLRPTGYFRVKTQRLRHFCHWYLACGGYTNLQQWSTATLRTALLTVQGIGPETADDILLYAFQRPLFVIDTYTRRLLVRLGWIIGDESYEDLQQLFEQHLAAEVDLYSQYHALIVIHAKIRCKKNKPICSTCLLKPHCHYVF